MNPAAVMALLILALLHSISPSALGHEGEDHGTPSPAPDVREAAPRTSAASDAFEVVAVLNGRQLVIYLDRFASNEPVPGARVEIDGSVHGTATESAPGVYAIDASAIAMSPSGDSASVKHPLTISIETHDSADLLPVTLEIAPAATISQTHDWRAQPGWLWVAGALLASVGILAVIFRSRRRKGGR